MVDSPATSRADVDDLEFRRESMAYTSFDSGRMCLLACGLRGGDLEEIMSKNHSARLRRVSDVQQRPSAYLTMASNARWVDEPHEKQGREAQS